MYAEGKAEHAGPFRVAECVRSVALRCRLVCAVACCLLVQSCRIVHYPIVGYEVDPDSGSVIDSCVVIVSTRPPVYVRSFKIFPMSLHVKYPKDKRQQDSSGATP